MVLLILFFLLLHHDGLLRQTARERRMLAIDLSHVEVNHPGLPLSLGGDIGGNIDHRVAPSPPSSLGSPATATAGVAGEGGGEDAEDQLQEATEGEEENEDAGSVSDNIEGGQDYKDCARQRGEE